MRINIETCDNIEQLRREAFRLESVMEAVVERFDSMKQTNSSLLKRLEKTTNALEGLLDDTQHEDHDCEENHRYCPVEYARKILKELRG